MPVQSGRIIIRSRRQAMPPDSPAVESEAVGSSSPSVTSRPGPAAAARAEAGIDRGGCTGEEFSHLTDRDLQGRIRKWEGPLQAVLRTAPDGGQKMQAQVLRMKEELERRMAARQRKVHPDARGIDRQQVMPPNSPAVELEVAGSSSPSVVPSPTAVARTDADIAAADIDRGGCTEEFSHLTDQDLQNHIRKWEGPLQAILRKAPDGGQKMQSQVLRMKEELERRMAARQRKVHPDARGIDRQQVMPPNSPAVESEVVGSSSPSVVPSPTAVARADADIAAADIDRGGCTEEFSHLTDQDLQNHIRKWEGPLQAILRKAPDGGQKMQSQVLRMKELERRMAARQRKDHPDARGIDWQKVMPPDSPAAESGVVGSSSPSAMSCPAAAAAHADTDIDRSRCTGEFSHLTDRDLQDRIRKWEGPLQAILRKTPDGGVMMQSKVLQMKEELERRMARQRKDHPDARGAAIYGKDIATGEGAEGLVEAVTNMEAEENLDLAVEEDRMSETPRRTSDRNSVDSTSSTSKRRRDKDSSRGNEGTMSSDPFLGMVGELRGDLKNASEYFRKMTAAMEIKAKIQEEAVQKDPMQALQEKSISELSRLGFSGSELVNAASVFVNIPNQMTMLFALPENLRREFILKMLADDARRRN